VTRRSFVPLIRFRRGRVAASAAVLSRCRRPSGGFAIFVGDPVGPPSVAADASSLTEMLETFRAALCLRFVGFVPEVSRLGVWAPDTFLPKLLVTLRARRLLQRCCERIPTTCVSPVPSVASRWNRDQPLFGKNRSACRIFFEQRMSPTATARRDEDPVLGTRLVNASIRPVAIRQSSWASQGTYTRRPERDFSCHRLAGVAVDRCVSRCLRVGGCACE